MEFENLESPQYTALARVLRDRITAGHYPPGGRLPSEITLCQTYSIDRKVVQRAIGILRREGLVITVHGRGTYVRRHTTKTTIHLDINDIITSRMPTPEETTNLAIPEGVPVLVRQTPHDIDIIYPADRTQLCSSLGSSQEYADSMALDQVAAADSPQGNQYPY